MTVGETVGNLGASVTHPRAMALTELHDLLLEMDQLKLVVRQNPIAKGARQETTAEHSWHLAVAVLLFARFAGPNVDINKAVSLAVVHDIPEVFVGDTFVYSPQIRSRRNREMAAMRQLADSHRNLVEVQDIFNKWQEYENCLTPEGQFVMALDVLLPVFLNYSNPNHSSWKRHGVSRAQVRERIDRVRDYCPDVADFALDVVDDATKRGLLSQDSA